MTGCSGQSRPTRSNPMQYVSLAELLDRRTVCQFFGGTKPLDPATLYRGIRKGRYPKPVHAGSGSSRWLVVSVSLRSRRWLRGGRHDKPNHHKAKIPELALHSLCTIIPPCTEEEFKELKEDIKNNGSKCRSRCSRSKSSTGVVGTRPALSLSRRASGRVQDRDLHWHLRMPPPCHQGHER